MRNRILLGTLVFSVLLITLILQLSGYLHNGTAIMGMSTSDKKQEVVHTNIVINEIIPKNDSLQPDDYGNYLDVIELYNPTSQPIQLSGYGLSDDPSKPHKWQFGDRTIEPKSYGLVYANPIEDVAMPTHRKVLEVSHYTNFKLKSTGERLVLSDPEGHILQILQYEALESNMSVGLLDGKCVYFLKGTPAAENEGILIENILAYHKRLEIKSSHPAGIYTEPFDLTFEKIEGYDLRYTLDGRDPTIASAIYSEPIHVTNRYNTPLQYANISGTYYDPVPVKRSEVNRGTVVKARYFEKSLPIGETYVSTYFVWQEGKERYHMDVVSLTTDPSNLFDSKTGIYVVGDKFLQSAPTTIDGSTPANYNQRGREWEREAHIEFFDKEGATFYEQEIGIRTFGAWSRANTKKSFKLFARSQYDALSTFEYPFFSGLTSKSGQTIQSFNQLVLRAGGNDTEYAMIRDDLTDELARGIVDFQEYKQVILFLNGEYWGIYDLREQMDENYIAAHYEVNAEEVSIIAYTPEAPELYVGEAAELERFKTMVNEMEASDLSDETTYQRFASKMDLNNFIYYYLTQIYIANGDWPGNNTKIWRYTGPKNTSGNEKNGKDGKYRFLLYDTEFSFGMYVGAEGASVDSFSFLENSTSNEWPNPAWSTALFRGLMENAEFRQMLIRRMEDLLNSRFEKTQVQQTIQKVKNIYQPEMDEYIHRWHFWALNQLSDWELGQIGTIMTFADRRGTALFQKAQKVYNLGEICKMTVENPTGANILVNQSYRMAFQNVKGESTSNQELTYFSDHAITLTVHPEAGTEFVKWELTTTEGDAKVGTMEEQETSKTITIHPVNGLKIKAVMQSK